MLKKTSYSIWIILLLALGLRFIGISHGFPFIFHPDEPTIVRSALGIRFDINPKHFDWPHLYIYLNYFLYMIFAKLRDLAVVFGYKQQILLALPLIWNDDLIFYLLSRSFSAILGALTVIPIYFTAKTIFGKKAGLLSGLALAIAPFHVWHSHYALADVPMMFFLSWSLYFSSRVLFKKDAQAYIWAGLFAGLAASTKYNGLLIAGALVLAHLFRVFSEREEKLLDIKSWGKLILAGLASVAGFLAGTPFALIDYSTFLRTDGPQGALWQFTNVGSVDFVVHVKQFFSVLVNKLPENFGYTLLVLFLTAFLYVIVNMIRTKKVWINKDLLFFTVVGLGLIFYVSGLEKTRSHYFFIAYPAVLIGGIGFLSQQLDKLNFKLKELIWVFVFLPPLYFSIIGARTFYNSDTRQQLYYWLFANKSKISRVYTNDADIKPVFDMAAVGAQVVKSEAEILNPQYLVLSDGDAFTINPAGYEKVLCIENKGKRGPNIKIYSQ